MGDCCCWRYENGPECAACGHGSHNQCVIYNRKDNET